MNSEDTLYGHIKNGVLTISGNSPSIRVDGGYLVVSDGPVAVPINHKGTALRLEKRMITGRFRRAGCPIKRIVVTRPDGFITFAAIKWLHGIGAGLVQLDWDGTVLLATAPAGSDQPGLRRAQVLAASNEVGQSVTRELLRAKLLGQAAVARHLNGEEVSDLISDLASELDGAADGARLLAIEATAATAYWPLWVSLAVRFARQSAAPEHWRTFGGRHSPLSGKARKAATPATAIVNYLYTVLASEMTIALTGFGLDPGLGIFHSDLEYRPSLSYDAIEAARPCVDSWLVSWLSTARFAKRDFYEEADGTIRITRPLTSHLSMTAAVWRPITRMIASWLARNLAGDKDEALPLPALPVPRRAWKGLEPPVIGTCHECGKALSSQQKKFCSQACNNSFNIATTIRPAVGAGPALTIEHGGTTSRAHTARLWRAWNAEHKIDTDQLRHWFETTVAPLLSNRTAHDIRDAAGLSMRYALMIRSGYLPHPRHYSALAALVGIESPSN